MPPESTHVHIDPLRMAPNLAPSRSDCGDALQGQASWRLSRSANLTAPAAAIRSTSAQGVVLVEPNRDTRPQQRVGPGSPGRGWRSFRIAASRDVARDPGADRVARVYPVALIDSTPPCVPVLLLWGSSIGGARGG